MQGVKTLLGKLKGLLRKTSFYKQSKIAVKPASTQMEIVNFNVLLTIAT